MKTKILRPELQCGLRMNEVEKLIMAVKVWVIGALLCTMCRIGGFIGGVEGVKIIPEIFARDFADGEKVDIMVNKLTSTSTQIPMGYYSLPFCQPLGGLRGVKGTVEWRERFYWCGDSAVVVRNEV